MARGKDGSLLTKEQLIKLNRQRFDEGVASGNLYNTGPITEEGGTEFGTDRWASYFEDNPEEAPNNWIVGETTSETYLDESTQEFIVDKDETKILDDKGEVIFQPSEGIDEGDRFIEPEEYQADNATKRGLTGQRDSQGTLTITPLTRNEKGEKVNLEEFTKEKNAVIRNKLEKVRGSIKDKKDKLAMMEATNIDAESEAEVDIEQEDSMENWMDNFESMSDEMFMAIDFKDLEKYGANAEDAYTEVKLAKDKADSEFTDAQMDAAESDREAMEMGAELDAEIAQDQADEEQLSDAESERMIMEATADQDKMEGDAELRDFPMMNMSDKDKGMFQFQKTDTIANEKEQASIDTIMGDTDMNPEQARQLMTKLKGICG
jgi:hypothetical protein